MLEVIEPSSKRISGVHKDRGDKAYELGLEYRIQNRRYGQLGVEACGACPRSCPRGKGRMLPGLIHVCEGGEGPASASKQSQKGRRRRRREFGFSGTNNERRWNGAIRDRRGNNHHRRRPRLALHSSWDEPSELQWAAATTRLPCCRCSHRNWESSCRNWELRWVGRR